MSRETLDTLRARLGISLNQVPAVYNAVPVIRHKTVQELVDLIHGHVNSTYQAREVLAENLETILLASLELERRIVLTSYVGTQLLMSEDACDMFNSLFCATKT